MAAFELNYRLSGSEGAPVVTLAHGLATDMTMWDGVMPALEERFRVLRYDSRGHGGSPANADDFTLGGLGHDVIGLLDQLNVAQTHFIGLSMGGMVGMGLALDHPERLSSLVVCDARGDAPRSYRDSWSGRIERVQAGGVETIVEPTLERWFASPFKARDDRMAFMRAMMLRTSVEGYIGSAEALKELDYARRLPEIALPTLFIVGSEDVGAPPSTMRAMHEATPGSGFVEIEGAGHLSAVEQPHAVATAIMNFLNRVTERQKHGPHPRDHWT